MKWSHQGRIQRLCWRGGLSYGAIFSIIDGTNCSPKAVLACRSVNLVFISFSVPEADPGFQVRGPHLKKLRRAEGGAKIFGVFRVKNHDFTPKKSYFFPILGGRARAGCVPTWIRPWTPIVLLIYTIKSGKGIGSDRWKKERSIVILDMDIS